MKKIIIASILIILFVFTKDVCAQKVNCWKCNGSKWERQWIDPQECQNCVDWNTSYRRKVPCYVCKDTRRTPNRRHRMITCTICKGTGRDYTQEKRNDEFGGSDYILTSNSIVTVYGLKVHEGNWRKRTQKDEWYAPKMGYTTAESLCQSLGNGWRLPTHRELNLLFKAQNSNQYDLGFDGIAEYWTSTSLESKGRMFFVLSNESREGYGTTKDILYSGYASCKCINSN